MVLTKLEFQFHVPSFEAPNHPNRTVLDQTPISNVEELS
jgi:hypothetical protein